MDKETYLKQRVEEQIGWYDKKSASNKGWFLALRTVEIIVAILIPFFSGTDLITFPYFVGILGIIVASAAGVISLRKYQENWIEYRSTSEALKHEKYVFLTNAGMYGGTEEERFKEFVNRIENLISKEHSRWKEIAEMMAKSDNDLGEKNTQKTT